MRKKVLVISHERSGTHFLINALASNFGYLPDQIDVDGRQHVNWGDATEVARWWDQFRGVPVRNIFKSHHDLSFFLPILDLLADEYCIFYVYRDGRDTLTSFWRYLNQLKPGWGPRTATVGDFLRAYPSGGIVQYQSVYHLTILDRWIAHVAGWHGMASRVCVVSYENLNQQFDGTMTHLAQHLGETPAQSFVRPGLDAPSSLPWQGKTGTWKEYFTQEDIAYFASKAGEVMCKLGYKDPD